MKRYAPVLIFALFVIGLVYWINRQLDPAPETIASASLQGMREQNRLSAFAANYSAVVTSEQRRFGLSAKKTLIMQGLVRYEVDLSTLTNDDVRWDSSTKTLSIRIPPIIAAPPQIDLKSIQEYGEGGILRTLTNADDVLDAANRDKGQAELVRQAKGAVPMKLARDAFKRALAQNFATPLRAAGIEVKVDSFFADEERDPATTRWDVSTPLKDIMTK
jgi:Protein of unknown function (DUF4230)